jgi:uncharacterized protein (DUF488 family)
MKIYTIGFAKKNAEDFFALLINNGIQRIVDVRLKNVSQMAGFTKKDDLKYFLRKIADIDYVHLPVFAPTKEILQKYRKDKNWNEFEAQFQKLLGNLNPLPDAGRVAFSEKTCCLLCSEEKPEKCHRRLVAEYLARSLSEPVQIIHL